MNIYFEEHRNLSGIVIVTLNLENAQVDLHQVPDRYQQFFDNPDTIGFYVFDLNFEPVPKTCIKIRAAWIAPNYRDDWSIESLLLDAIERVCSLHPEGLIECVAVSTTDQREDAINVLNLWDRFKQLQGSNSNLHFFKSHVPSLSDMKNIEDDEYGIHLSSLTWARENQFDYVRLQTQDTILGIPLTSFKETLPRVPAEFNASPMDTIAGLLANIFDKYPKQQEQHKHYSTLKDYLDSLPARYFSAFTFEERVKIFFSIYAYSPLAYFFAGKGRGRAQIPNPQPSYELAEKLKLSIYQYGDVGKDRDWNTFADAYNQIPLFDFGLGTQTSIDWPKATNTRGWAKYSRIFHADGKWPSYRQGEQNYDRIYADCKFVYIISKNGKPLIYIGFSVADNHRIMVCQIQLAKKRGNRWLYKLGMPYFDYTLLKIQEAFPQFDIYLVEGESLANKIRSNYDSENPLTPDKYQHIIRTYERPLEYFDRDEEQSYIGYHSRKLHPRELED